jgi:AraC-like DNA-binding protein/quercetin dioxygenase-like cupin family protein
MTTLDLRNTPERRILNLSRLGGVRVLGCYRYAGPHPPLPPHRHPGMMEICFLYRGMQWYEVGGRLYQLRGGDMFVTLPGERHSTGPEPEDRGILYWLILEAGGKGILGLSVADSRALTRALLGMPARQFRAPRNTRRVLDGFFAAPGDRLMRISRRCQMVDFLLGVARASQNQMRASSTEWIEPVLQHMERNIGQNLQVPDFAAVAGISISRFKARFRESLGKAPAEYYLALRIEEAKRRLAATGRSVTQIAMDLGFGSSQGFATSFRRIAGASPSEYRSVSVFQSPVR